MVFIGKEAVAQRDDAPMPTIALQEVERYRSAVIDIESFDPHHREILFGGHSRHLVQQLIVTLAANGGSRRAEHCKVAGKPRSVVRDKRVPFKWSLPRN